MRQTVPSRRVRHFHCATSSLTRFALKAASSATRCLPRATPQQVCYKPRRGSRDGERTLMMSSIKLMSRLPGMKPAPIP